MATPTRANWEALERAPQFRALLAAKRRFILPATIFFLVYYFALPVLVGYMPNLMKQTVVGRVNLAYLFALSQFLMAWVLAFLYVRAAVRFDRLAEEIRAEGERTSR